MFSPFQFIFPPIYLCQNVHFASSLIRVHAIAILSFLSRQPTKLTGFSTSFPFSPQHFLPPFQISFMFFVVGSSLGKASPPPAGYPLGLRPYSSFLRSGPTTFGASWPCELIFLPSHPLPIRRLTEVNVGEHGRRKGGRKCTENMGEWASWRRRQGLGRPAVAKGINNTLNWAKAMDIGLRPSPLLFLSMAFHIPPPRCPRCFMH